MSDVRTLHLQESTDNNEVIFDSVDPAVTVQPRLLVRFPKQYQLSENLLYWQRIERVIGTRIVDTYI